MNYEFAFSLVKHPTINSIKNIYINIIYLAYILIKIIIISYFLHVKCFAPALLF